MTRGRHHIAGALAVLAASALLGVSAWLPAAASAADSVDPTAPGPVPPPVLDDVMGRAEGSALPELPVGLGALPGVRETAAFAAGRVAVGVVFLESDGTSENWTRQDPDPKYAGEDRRQLVLAQIQSALDWWNARSPDGSLELFMPAAGAYGAPQTIATGYEPIKTLIRYGYGGQRDVLTDAGWRWEAMKALDFGHDALDDRPYPETLFANKLRLQNDADWAFVLYVVDSLLDTDGMFRKNQSGNAAIAYTADLFGPYSVLTYDNDGYTFDNFGAVLAHEMGHVFGALDEYAPPAPGYPSTGNLRSGYLGVLNGNAEQGGSTHYDCIMRGAQQTLDSFRLGSLCRWTRGQTGLRDSDADTRPDVVDTRPAFSTRLESTDKTTGGVTLQGTVMEQPRKRGRISTGVYFRHDISIKGPHDARYRVRVEGGAWQPWQPMVATDGAFDEQSESWRLTTDPLATGHYFVRLEATTGETAGRTRDLWAGPTPVTLELAANTAFTKTTVTVAAGSTVRLYARSTGTDTGTGTVWPVPRLAPVRLVRLAAGSVLTLARVTTGENGVWTGTIKPARSGVYEVRFAGAGQFLRPTTFPRVTITVK